MRVCHCTLPLTNPNACDTCISAYPPQQKWTQTTFPFVDNPSGTATQPFPTAPTPMPDPDSYFQKKQDSGKLPWNLLDLDSIEGIVEVLKFGADKYSPNSWKTVPDAIPRYTAALMRHLVALQRGEYLDPESGLPHTYHIACNAMFLTYFYKVAHSDAY